MASFCERTVNPKSIFDARSFRWIRSGKARVLVGCPKGKWAVRKARCKVGLKARAILVPRPRCKKDEKRVRK